MEFIHKEIGYRIYAIDISKYPLISYDGGLKRCLYIQFFLCSTWGWTSHVFASLRPNSVFLGNTHEVMIQNVGG
jgi:hypothetical protein